MMHHLSKVKHKTSFLRIIKTKLYYESREFIKIPQTAVSIIQFCKARQQKTIDLSNLDNQLRAWRQNIYNMDLKEEENHRIIPASRHKHTTIDSDEDDQAFMQQIKQIKIAQKPPIPAATRKRVPNELQTTPQKDNDMDIEGKVQKVLRYSDLPEEVVFYITQIYPYGHRLFITGVTQEGHTLSLVASQPLKELYFCLKSEYSDSEVHSPAFLQRAEREITERLHDSGINKFHGQFEQKCYVFELEGIPRVKRPFYKVRYPFGKDGKEDIRADWEGETFKYVFGTTYNPLELFVLNGGVKGPAWVKVEKRFLNESSKWVEGTVCAQIQDAELLQVVNEITRTPSMRVMSISIKSVVPAQVKLKKLFNTNRVDELHIYAISYFFCDDYQIESKPASYKGSSRTFFLKEFGAAGNREFQSCENEKQMFAQFQAEIRRLDPDVIVCHDSAKIIDTLIQRMARIGDKHERPRLGRLVFAHEISKSNQNQRIGSTLAGRLLCDTFMHSRDMIKSVDYELEEMAKHIKPERVFKGHGEEQTLSYLNDNKAFQVIRKAQEQAELTFALMNHLQILQITRQLSNICGNIWRRSLDIQRAQRNEFLIMHECVKRDLIVPDKFRKDKNDDEQETDKKKYQGGHVIDPLKGFYKDYILLLDFNSLYPSIIREYNVCFSVIKRPLAPLTNYYKPKKTEKKHKEEDQMKEEKIEQRNDEFDVNPPEKSQCSRDKWGFLPQLIDKIVERRKKAKKDMKKATAEKAVILDIQQKCYKLVANSIYGCLGFSISRFYSKHLAALITRMGREALLRAKDIVSSTNGVRVIYGDTDSLMIQPQNLQDKNEKEKLFQIKKVAEELKKNINKEYSNLEIDIDGIFKPLILLMKKKYVARKLNNFDAVIAGQQANLSFSIEHKGIEVVRRDGCELQRQFLKKIIQILMESDKSQPQETYEEIYNYVKEFSANFSKNSFKEFLFSKQLSKPPAEYARGETIPHVKVALDRLKAGERVETLVNHTIYYIVCKPKDKSQDSLAKCCFDDRAYERSLKFQDQKGPLQIDEEYYKRQLLQPVGRITQHLEDFSTDRLLEEIGLSDQARKKFKRQLEVEREEGEAVLQGCITHSGIQKCKKFSQIMGEMTCVCTHKFSVAEQGKFTISCPSCKRQALPNLSNKLTLFLKEQILQYYNNSYKCKCGRQFNLNPLEGCLCKIKFKPRSNVPFDLHELIYLSKDLCMATHKDASMETKQRLEFLEEKLNRFMEDSDFERVAGLNNILKM